MCDRVKPRNAEQFKAIEAPRLQNTIIPDKEKVKPNEKKTVVSAGQMHQRRRTTTQQNIVMW